MQPHAQIGILGNVERVPRAKLPKNADTKMVGCAAKRQREAKTAEQRQKPPKQRRVFDCELARQPVLLCVEIVEPRLQAGKFGRCVMENGGGFAKLVRIRAVLGVVDDRKVPCRKLQRIIEGFRLRARLTVRNDDEIDIAREIELRGGLDGGLIDASSTILMSSFAAG